MYLFGVPVKISAQGAIYIPVNYMIAIGIDRYYDYLIRRELDRQFIYCPYQKRPLLQNEVIVNLRAGVTYLPVHWLNASGLIPGRDSLYMVGVDDGLLCSVTKRILF